MEPMSTTPGTSLTTLARGRSYSEPRFRAKLARAALQAGREVVERALWLYFAAARPETPAWAKTTVYAALAYFIVPLDAIPDLAPVAGYADDLGVLALAVATIARYIDSDVKSRARRVLARWFPAEPGPATADSA